MKQRQYQCVFQVREWFLGLLLIYFLMMQRLFSTSFISGPPVFRLKEVGNNFTYETVSLVPANYTWMSCSVGHRYDYSLKCSSQRASYPDAYTQIHTHTHIKICISSSLSHCSCEDSDSLWKEIPGTSQTDSDVFCNKMIKSSLNRELANEHMLRFCLTNSVGSWCKPAYSALSPQANKGNKFSFTLQNS